MNDSPFSAIQYDLIRNELCTGDILLFAGKGRVSDTIKCITRSYWSHVGMIYTIRERDLVCSWESMAFSNLKDINLGIVRAGVQMVTLSDRIMSYPGVVAVRRLEPPLEIVKGQLEYFRREVAERPYESHKMELLKAALDWPGMDNIEDLNSLFCSELVAEAYQRLGLLAEGDIPSNEFVPADFSSERSLPLLMGRTLTKEVQLLP